MGYLMVAEPAGVTVALLGYLYNIVPFLLWQACYGPHVGRQKAPQMRDPVHQRSATFSFWPINGGLLWPLPAPPRMLP